MALALSAGGVGIFLVQAHAQEELFKQLIETGNLQVDQSQWWEANETYTEALTIKPDDSDALYCMARLNFARFNAAANPSRDWLVRAEVFAQWAVRSNPEHDKAWNALGGCSKKLGKLDEAIEAYDRALAIKPNAYHSLVNKGTALALARRIDEAEAVLKKATTVTQRCPYSIDTWRNLAAFQLFLGDDDEAFASLVEAGTCEKSDLGAQMLRVQYWLERDLKQATNSLAVANYLARDQSQEHNARLNRLNARVALCEGNFKVAARVAQVAIEKGDEPTICDLLMAIALYASGDAQRGEEALGRASNDPQWKNGFIPVAPHRELWFDTLEQVHKMRAVATQAARQAAKLAPIDLSPVCPP